MRNSTRKRVALAVAVMLGAIAGLNVASASPSAKPSPAVSVKPAPSAEPTSRTAIVSCRYAPFFSWPDQTQEPSPATYPGARQGDAFGVLGTGTLTHTGGNLTETTIDVVQPYGFGKHYWVQTECIT